MSYTAIVDLRLKPEDVEGAGAAVRELLEATRSLDGNQGVDVLIDEAAPAHWLLVESWASAEHSAAYSAWRAGEGRSVVLRPYLAAPPSPSKSRVADL